MRGIAALPIIIVTVVALAGFFVAGSLTLARGEKGKLHWHINFGPNPLDGKQTIKLNLTLLRDGQTLNIDEEFNRDSGTVFTKENH